MHAPAPASGVSGSSKTVERSVDPDRIHVIAYATHRNWPEIPGSTSHHWANGNWSHRSNGSSSGWPSRLPTHSCHQHLSGPATRIRLPSSGLSPRNTRREKIKAAPASANATGYPVKMRASVPRNMAGPQTSPTSRSRPAIGGHSQGHSQGHPLWKALRQILRRIPPESRRASPFG